MIEKLTNGYLLFVIVVTNVVLTIIDNTSTQEIFAIFQLSVITILIGLKTTLVRGCFRSDERSNFRSNI